MSDFYAEKETRARRPRVCCECNGLIEAGEVYTRLAGKSDGDFWSACGCKPCMAAHDAYREQHPREEPLVFGELKEALYPETPEGINWRAHRDARRKRKEEWRKEQCLPS